MEIKDNKFIKKANEEFIHANKVLWKNEVNANIFVAKVMIGCAAVLVMSYIFACLGYIEVDTGIFLYITIRGTIELVAPALVCFALKGRKQWLKIFLSVFFIFAIARIQSILTYAVVLMFALPVVLSTKYYSKVFTNFVAILTVLLSGLAIWYAAVNEGTLLDMNYIHINNNFLLDMNYSTSLDTNVLANYNFVDINAYLNASIWQGLVTRLFQYAIITAVCSSVAESGREMIFEQKAETENHSRIDTELDLASKIQAAMLPNKFPAFPNRNEFDIYASMKPAKEVGGDFYDYFFIDDNHLALVVADVSGKGVPAAIFASITMTLIEDHTQLGLTPAEVFTTVNNKICINNTMGLFVTAFMAIVEIDSGNVTYVNAGHNPPVFKHNGVADFLKCKPGFVLGGLENVKYKQYEFKLDKGDRLFLYTDGITEATSLRNELYGNDRLIKCINSIKNKSVFEGIKLINDDIKDFVGGALQFDDMTMVAFSYSNDAKIEKTFSAIDANLNIVLEFVETELEKHNCKPAIQMKLALAVEELFVNICHYAYTDKVGEACISMKFDGDDVRVKLIDSGIEFNPLEKEDPNIHLDAEERQIGGLGIYMVKQMMDDIYYERKEDNNILTFRKKIK